MEVKMPVISLPAKKEEANGWMLGVEASVAPLLTSEEDVSDMKSYPRFCRNPLIAPFTDRFATCEGAAGCRLRLSVQVLCSIHTLNSAHQPTNTRYKLNPSKARRAEPIRDR